MIKKIYFFLIKNETVKNILIFFFKLGGKKPWSLGYNEYKWKNIKCVLGQKFLMDSFRKNKLPEGFGIGIDERIIEYPWVFANVTKISKDSNILDAGSVFNYSTILNLNILRNKSITIFNYNPEVVNFNEKRISYVYGDLRNLPFKDMSFDKIVCQSTIEHIDMDNSIYGYNMKNSSQKDKKSYEYLKVIKELCRVLGKSGELFMTFPFGKYENHGFFQQFDSEMFLKIKHLLNNKGIISVSFMKYTRDGWNFSTQFECLDSVSYNPHTGVGKGEDGAAHCRAICCIKFTKT
jgi:SAM-dependent methyltransferase